MYGLNPQFPAAHPLMLEHPVLTEVHRLLSLVQSEVHQVLPILPHEAAATAAEAPHQAAQAVPPAIAAGPLLRVVPAGLPACHQEVHPEVHPAVPRDPHARVAVGHQAGDNYDSFLVQKDSQDSGIYSSYIILTNRYYSTP